MAVDWPEIELVELPVQRFSIFIFVSDDESEFPPHAARKQRIIMIDEKQRIFRGKATGFLRHSIFPSFVGVFMAGIIWGLGEFIKKE
ncbi:MAG TPA: hypothetical protein VIU33_08560 [Nitrospiria bacterium]